ncbi:MAG: SDR family oxidoreductase [Candidatus Aenigmarchaeota archaeon]|nr:SDR family oxidoreductase [Candidatus Aenigmarchaeota archaeon]
MTKVVAITGAYSGLGEAISRLFAKKGYKLVLGGRNKELLEKLVSDIRKDTSAIGIEMDVRKKVDCEKFIQSAIDAFDRIDILINNAGIWKMAPIEDITEQDIRDMFETNIFGPIYLSQAAVKIMKKQKSGHILNIGSTAGIDYKSSHIAYGSSKFALIGFTGCLKTELQGTSVNVSVFSPGGMKTKLFRSKPERMKDTFMDPIFVAQKILEHIENPSDEWSIVLRRPSQQ